jgi:hypothetical protein
MRILESDRWDRAALCAMQHDELTRLDVGGENLGGL